MEQMQQRPTGVAVMAIVAAVVGVIALLGAAAWWNTSEHIYWLPSLSGGARLMALGLLAIGLLELVLAYGAWMLRPWAWTFGVVAQVILIVVALGQFGRSDIARHIITIVIAGITLWYLSTPRAKAAFGRS
jgi:uncharacterized membrane protein (DUF2068 family)